MLSPREKATLVLLRDLPAQIDMARGDFGTLLERQLVRSERTILHKPI